MIPCKVNLGAIAAQPLEISLRLKLFFWFILSAFSVFFAEVVSGSYPFPFFNPFKPWDMWGWLVLMPLYGLHTLVLASVVFNYGKPRFYALFLAGAIFGLYEAYITKVLWDPPWGAPVVSLGGVAVIELVVISLFWHPFMSFVIPLTAAETGLTGSGEILDGLPANIKRLFAKRGLVLFFIFSLWAGANHGGAGLVSATFSALISVGFLLALIRVWENRTRGMKYPLRALLPDRRQTRYLLSALIALYVVGGAAIYPQRIPGVASQAPIWALYALTLGLLVLAIRRSRTDGIPGPHLGPALGRRHLLAFAVVFTVASAVSGFFGLSVVVLVMSWFPGFALGLAFYVWSAWNILRRPRVDALPPAGEHSQS